MGNLAHGAHKEKTEERWAVILDIVNVLFIQMNPHLRVYKDPLCLLFLKRGVLENGEFCPQTCDWLGKFYSCSFLFSISIKNNKFHSSPYVCYKHSDQTDHQCCGKRATTKRFGQQLTNIPIPLFHLISRRSDCYSLHRPGNNCLLISLKTFS